MGLKGQLSFRGKKGGVESTQPYILLNTMVRERTQTALISKKSALESRCVTETPKGDEESFTVRR
jgi:hypothetical protein